MARTITDLDIQALIDGEVSEQDYVDLFEAVSRDPNLYNRYLLYKKQKNLLKSWWKDN